MKDRHLVYTHVNPVVEKHNQLPADQIIGKTDADLFGEAAAAEIREAICGCWRAKSTNRRWSA